MVDGNCGGGRVFRRSAPDYPWRLSQKGMACSGREPGVWRKCYGICPLYTPDAFIHFSLWPGLRDRDFRGGSEHVAPETGNRPNARSSYEYVHTLLYRDYANWQHPRRLSVSPLRSTPYSGCRGTDHSGLRDNHDDFQQKTAGTLLVPGQLT